MEKLGTTNEQKNDDTDNIRTKLRSVEKFKPKKLTPQDFKEYIRPIEFNNVVSP